VERSFYKNHLTRLAWSVVEVEHRIKLSTLAFVKLQTAINVVLSTLQHYFSNTALNIFYLIAEHGRKSNDMVMYSAHLQNLGTMTFVGCGDQVQTIIT